MPLRDQILYKALIAIAFLSGTLGAVGEYLMHGTAHPTYLFVLPALLLAAGILAIHLYHIESSAKKKNKRSFK